MSDLDSLDHILKPDVRAYWANAYFNCIGMVCAAAITSSLDNLLVPLEQILHHQHLDSLNLPETGFGGLHAQMLCYFFVSIVGMEKMHEYIRRRAKTVRDIAAMQSDSGLHGTLLAPEPRDFEAFIGKLQVTPNGEKLPWNTGPAEIFDGFAKVAQEILGDCQDMAKDELAL